MTTTVVQRRLPIADGWEIVAVESTSCAVTTCAGALVATATREPVTVIVRGPWGEQVFDLVGSSHSVGAASRCPRCGSATPRSVPQ